MSLLNDLIESRGMDDNRAKSFRRQLETKNQLAKEISALARKALESYRLADIGEQSYDIARSYGNQLGSLVGERGEDKPPGALWGQYLDSCKQCRESGDWSELWLQKSQVAELVTLVFDTFKKIGQRPTRPEKPVVPDNAEELLGDII